MGYAQGVIATETQTFWLQWVEAAFPDLESQAYFLPPVYVNRVPMTRQSVGGQDVWVLQHAPGQACQSMEPATTPPVVSISQPFLVQDSDTRDDAAMQRVLLHLQRLFDQNGEVLVGISQLQFGQYLGEPCYAAEAAQLPLPANLPPDLPRNWKKGDFDVLLIHRHYGFVVCEVKSFGENVRELDLTQQDINSNIKRKLRQAVSQLDKAEAMLSHLVSDVCPDLRITKTIAVPNLPTAWVQQAISDDPQLSQDLCRCLGTSDPADIAGLCLCCDQLSDPKTPCDVSSHVLRELGHWWQRRVAGAGPDRHMTFDLFCGPATTVSVKCIFPPRVSVKTLSQAVWWTGECYTAVITLFPEQVHLLHTAPPTLFVTGPPGTGKTVVLLLMAIQWLRCGHHVYVVSTWKGSRLACRVLHHLLLQTIKEDPTTAVSSEHLHLLEYDFFNDKKDADKAVKNLSQAATGGELFVIADEAGPKHDVQTFLDKLLTQIPQLHLWAASYYHEAAPRGWQEEHLTRPLRCPPTVVREVEKDSEITEYHVVHPYSKRGVADQTDGPPVTRLYHRGQGHTSHLPQDCVTCGREVASFLHSLRVDATENGQASSETSRSDSTPLRLQWRDMLMLYWGDVTDISGMVTGLQEAGIPVKVMKDDDIEDVATARSDVVWVASGDRVRGLERKVVVCLEHHTIFVPLHWMSRCTSQLVIVSPDD
ncbi:uncharacterized protein LOC112576346 isoform X2 [Pomacea canaliculata]|uniref:uncharacterized protein LOC112576346 isoform X2 n=1 Tax=Pomacea canaliculata TaxID=400727 RepID=UPI000D72CE0F|nr:uncharacterized protein LOC112576346 isoform X2 [Pomacea canaliculata]